MDKVQARARLLRDIIKAVNEARGQGVKDPDKKAIKAIKAQMKMNKFKSIYNLK